MKKHIVSIAILSITILSCKKTEENPQVCTECTLEYKNVYTGDEYETTNPLCSDRNSVDQTVESWNNLPNIKKVTCTDY